MTDFDQFWALYPRRVAKETARKALEKALKKVDLATILQGVRHYVEEVKETERQFIAHPATWLNQQRWDDEYETRGVDTSKFRRPSPEEARLYRQERPWMDRDPEWIPIAWRPQLRAVS